MCMKENSCGFLGGIAISVIVALIVSLLFYYGIFATITIAIVFSLILALVSIGVLAILSISDNGITRSSLSKNSISNLISIIGNVFFSIIALVVTLTAGTVLSAVLVRTFYFLLNIKLTKYIEHFIMCYEILIKI